MKTLKKRAALTLSAALVGTAFSGCGALPNEVDGVGKVDGDLAFWAQDSQKRTGYFGKNAIAALEAVYPNLTFKVFPRNLQTKCHRILLLNNSLM